ncbi:hypothetical protein [Nostoc sp. 'Lobaria pulmonaria (5183) cyanobiont']|uniref:hypothetical protein n=1 Tax=Nostoc sp. 'Lobaria pulmonaria (5183) cyanobiont' TaxID=1618022 RepID=UPI003FA60AA0
MSNHVREWHWFETIERLTEVNDNTVRNWVKEIALKFPDAPEHSEIPGFAQVDELETFVAILNQKKCLSYQFDCYCTTSIMDLYP